MKKRIYYSLIGISLVTIVLVVVLAGYFLYRSTATQVRMDLAREMHIVSAQFMEEQYNTHYLTEIADDADGQLRFTWIKQDGTVLYDSQGKSADMENHINRPEVREALRSGEGDAARISNTIDTSTHYLAMKLKDGSILRVAMERRNMYAGIGDVALWSLVVMIVLVALSLYAGRRLTKKLLMPLEETLNMMQHIRYDQKNFPIAVHTYPEIQPFIEKIKDQNDTIRRTIRTLAEERNIMRLMMEQIQEGFILFNNERNILAVNNWAVTFLNQGTKENLEGKNVSSLRFAKCWTEMIEEAAAEERKIVRLLEEGERYYQISCQYIEKIKKKPGYLIVVTDITEEERREQLRREFTSNVSHELKTPLTSIRGFAEMISAGLYQDTKDIRHFATLIQGESKRLLSLIDALIHLSHIEETNKQMQKEAVSLKELAEELYMFLEPLCAEKRVAMTVSGDRGIVHGNRALLRELCMNLMDNAIKYNIVGGTVAVYIHTMEDSVEFSVADTGIGIPENKQRQVFERFYRVDKSRAKATGGSGLGLAIVKHIAERHSGTIQMISKEGRGTTIVVRLPKYKQ